MAKSTRSSHELLPGIFQTEKNKKFLRSTLDQLVEPSALEKLAAYVGRRYNPSYRKNDVYLSEISTERQNYQLEPTVVYKSNSNDIDFVSPYIDTVNEIDSQGGSKTRHDTIWNQEFYSYSPNIDPDKFVNFREYYWINEGPISVKSNIDSPGSIITINVTNSSLNGYKFNHKPNLNPDVVIYRGNTYKFVINSPGHPFYIKNQYGTGTNDQANSDYVENNGTEQGTVTLYVPTSDSSTIPETVLYYQCSNHQNMQGRFIIKDLQDEPLDINENLIGVNQFVDSLGLDYSSGQKISFSGEPSSDRFDTMYIEGVGNSITLVDASKLVIYEPYGKDRTELWDQNGVGVWDSQGWGETIGILDFPDYFTINRSSQDLNQWSRSNRWFHRSVIETANLKNNIQTTLEESQRAKRPIIEFNANLQLYNHGSIGRTVDIIDTVTTDALSKLQGSTGLSIDRETVVENDKIVFLNDPEQKNKIFTVHFDTQTDGSKILHLDDDSTTVSEGTSIVARRGYAQKGKTYHYQNSTWKSSQSKTKLQQKPLFDLFDVSGVSISNKEKYISSTFEGSTLFEIATDDTQGTPDTVYGTNVIYKRFGLISDITINDTYNSGTYSYLTTSGLKTFALRQFYTKFIKGINETLSNNWEKNLITNPQTKIEEYESLDNQKDFEIKAWKNSASLTDLTVKVYVNGVQNSDYTLKNTNQNKIIRFTTAKNKGDFISIKSISQTGTSTAYGFWETPVGSVSNPLNKNFKSFTLGDLNEHYLSATNHHPDFSGSSFGSNNVKDLNKFFSYSSQIVQHSGNLPLSAILIRDNVLNLPLAFRQASLEYEKIKHSIISKANDIVTNGTIDQQLDLILESISSNKNSAMAYFDSDMLGFGTNKKTLTYTVEDSNIKLYPITNQFDLDVLSNKSVYVYKNDVQLLHGYDYKFVDLQDSSAIIGISILTQIAENDVIKIFEYNTTNGSYIPATPAKLGLAPKFKPNKFLDDTYQSEDSTTQGVYVIQGHDGSITVAYDDFRDDLLLEFEKRIYNNIKTSYDPDIIDIKPGFFKQNNYTVAEYNKFFAREFYTWTGTYGVDYSTNNTFDSGNPFTFNYSNTVNGVNGERLNGFWRNIYKQWFGTDRPHTNPWEMFDFSEKPSWWDTRYGTSPYTGGNLLLWQDVREGFIADGPRKGYHRKYARENVLSVIPVNDAGELLSPNNAGILSSLTTSDKLYQNKWEYGDHSPVETAWIRSSSYRFAEQIAKFLAKPAQYAGLFFDTSRITKNLIGHYVYNSLYRTPINNYVLPTSNSFTSGYINTIVDYSKHLGYGIDYTANRLSNVTVQLSYKLGGFTNKDNMNVIVGSYTPASTNKSVFIPKENFEIILYKSAPVVTVNYSGVIVEKTQAGYKVSGYNNFDRSFTYYAPRKNNNSIPIVVGAFTDPYENWEAGGFYNQGTIVKNGSTFYRANSTHTSTQTFTESLWSSIGQTLPLKGGTRIIKYKDYTPTTSVIQYGYTFNNIQEVSEFLYGYGYYLEQQGFVFDEFSNELNLPIDWDLSVKEFLFWSTQNWQNSAVISLSPASSKLKFVKSNTIGDDLIGSNNYYTVLQQDGFPIQPTDISTSRYNGEFIIGTNPDKDGIYNADIRAVQKEHIIVFDNETSFKDVIYNDALGVRQDRVKLVGWKTANWNGDLYAPGYLIDQAKIQSWNQYVDYKKGDVISHQSNIYVVEKNHNSGQEFNAELYILKSEQPQKDLLPNWNEKSESFRDFYSLDTDNFDAEQQKYAQHLIGFQRRPYWENLGIDELTQYKFYQGMIRDKGTKKPLERFKSPTTVQDTTEYSFYEETAFRVGDYGGYRTEDVYEFLLKDNTHRQQQQIYQFTQSYVDDTQNIINVSSNNLTKRPYDLVYPLIQTSSWSSRNTPDDVFEYPMAGYVQPNQVQHYVFDETELLNYNVSNVYEGDRFWLANTSTRDWQVYRVSSIANNINFYEARDGILQFTTSKPHGLVGGDVIVVRDFDNEIDGIYKINETLDSTDNLFKFSVNFNGVFDSTRQNGNILKLTSVRINDIDNLTTISPSNGFDNGDYVFVDNNYQSGTGLWKVYGLNDDSFYKSKSTFFNQITNSNNLYFGSDVATNGSVMVVGSPGDNSVTIMLRNTSNDDFTVKNELVYPYRNNDNTDSIGSSVAMSNDGLKLFAGSPRSNSIQKLQLNASYPFSARQLIYGTDSESQGRVLYYDNVNYVLYVKVISGLFTTENIYLEDSSSVATISAVTGTVTEVNQGLVHVMTKDIYGSYGINHSVASPNCSSDEYFGYSIDTTPTGSYLFVGAPGSTTELNDSGTNPGKVYVFKLTNQTYLYHQTLVPVSSSQNLDRFGESVKVTDDGKRLIIGSPGYDRTGLNDSSTYDAGSAYVFDISNDDYFYQVQEIISLNDEPNIKFGNKVETNSHKDILISSPRESNQGTAVQGLVYYYKLNTTTVYGDGSSTSFSTDFDIDSSDTLSVVKNGFVVLDYSVSGNQVTLNSAPLIDEPIVISQYQQYQKISQPKSKGNSNFGENIHLDGNKLLVYASGYGPTKITTFDKFADDGSTVINETTFDGRATTFSSADYTTGAVLVYYKINTKFVYESTVQPNTLSSNDQFGKGLSSYDNNIFVGAPGSSKTVGASTYQNAGKLYRMSKNNKLSSGWELIQTQQELVDVDKIGKLFVYNKKTNSIISNLENIDPAKGKLFGEIEKNIFYKTIYDPADYDSWDQTQVGQTWLNLSKMKYAWYEQGDLNFKLLNWGKLHPSSTVEVYEWTESDYTPSQYNDISNTNEGTNLGVTGTAFSQFIQKSVFDTNIQQFKNKYYYWVINPTLLPNTANRTVDSASISNGIINPKLFTDSYSGVVANDSILVSYNPNLITNDVYLVMRRSSNADSLPKYTEFALVAKGDDTAVIPSLLIDKLNDSIVGSDESGRSVPDLNFPINMRYGIGNRPRQSMFVNRIEAIKNLVEYVNKSLSKKQFAGSKTLNYWLKKHELPSQSLEGYKIKVDTDIDLDFVNTETYFTGDTVLVEFDSRAENRWTINTFTSERKFTITKVQEYNTNLYWKYQDYYKDGYDSTLIADYAVPNENAMRTTEYVDNTIIKVESSYNGKFVIYKKTYNGFEIVGVEDGTYALETSLYDYANNYLGFDGDTYSEKLYDNIATTELRYVMKGLQYDVFTDDDLLNYSNLFFLLTSYAQQEQKTIDWTFKTSFIKSITTYNQLEQPTEFRFNTSESINNFVEEVLPFKSKIRENLERHKNITKFEGDITDFDNKSYYDNVTGKYVVPNVYPGDSTYYSVYHSNPWKFYSENYKYSVDSIIIGTKGEGYTSAPTITISGGGGTGATAVATVVGGSITAVKMLTAGSGYYSTPTITLTGGSPTTPAVLTPIISNKKIRSFETVLKFDRLNSNKEIVNSTIVDWQAFTTYIVGKNIRFNNTVYRVVTEFTSGKDFTSQVLLADSSLTDYLNVMVEWSATDRINSYYSPTSGMAGLIGDGSTNIDAYAQLMTGLEYKGTRVLGLKFEEGEGYDVEAYDISRYDAVEEDITDPDQLVNIDQIVDSKTFTTTLGTKAEDIDIVGDDFISEYSAHAPEEVLPGGVYDTLDMKIYTQPSTGSGVMSRATYFGDGVTKEFAVPGQINTLHSVRVFVDNQYMQDDSTDYGLDVINNKIEFTTAPANGKIISIHTTDVSVENLVSESEFEGDGSTTQFIVPVSRDIVTQSYVSVNSVKTPVTLSPSDDSSSTVITFGSAPVYGSKIFVYLFAKESGKAYSEMTTTEYPVSTLTNTVNLSLAVGVIGPFEHKVIVEGVSGTSSTNRYRLSPPQIAYYLGDGSTTSFAVPNSPTPAIEATEGTVEVWVNGIYQGDDSSINSDYTLSNDSTSSATITLNTAPAVGETVAVMLKIGHDYELNSDGNQIILRDGWSSIFGSDSSTINNEKIFVTTFTNHDQMNLRTEIFSFTSTGVGDEIITLASNPINSTYTFVSFNKEHLTPNFEYTVDGKKIIIPESVANNGLTNELIVSYVTGTVSKPAIGYRIFKDILNRYHYRRISKAHTTKLSQTLTTSDTTIEVVDGSVLANPSVSTNTPGVIWIGKERITYFTKVGNTLGQIMRGTLGTTISSSYSGGTKVVDASLVQNIPYQDTVKTSTFSGDGSTTQFTMTNDADSTSFTASSQSQLVVTVGGAKSTDFTVDGSSTITFNNAPGDSIRVRVTKKQGSVWYDQGTSTAANGLGLQASTGVEVQFLQNSPAELPDY